RTPILPRNAVFYAGKEGQQVFAVYEPPGMFVLKAHLGDRKTPVSEYSIKLPHVYYFFHFVREAFEELLVFGSQVPVERTSDSLCRLPLKNTYDDGRVCLGNDLKFSLEGRIEGKIVKVLEHFKGSVFNADLDHCMESAVPKFLEEAKREGESVLAAWARVSAEASFDPCGREWIVYQTWSNVVDRIFGEDT
ncbi:MAG: hypothetical protein V1809_00255, partial [Planctomycetota bacterium]